MEENIFSPLASLMPSEDFLLLSPVTDLACKENPDVLLQENNFLSGENSQETNLKDSRSSEAERPEPKLKRSKKRWEADRRRHQAEKEGFQRLCKIVPDLLVLKRPTKIEILKKTILYINELQKDVEELEKEANKNGV